MFEDRKQKKQVGRPGPSPQTAGSFGSGGKGGKGDDDSNLSRLRFGEKCQQYRRDYLAKKQTMKPGQ